MVAKIFYLTLGLICVASAAPENRIVGGTPTTIEQFPYISAFIYHYPQANIFIQRCVGSIVSSWHILATAYCFNGADLAQMHIRAGSTNSMEGGVIAYIRDVIKHPNYQENPLKNDIAVVTLRDPLSLSNTVNILFIPPPGIYLPDYIETKVVSWGFESEQGPQLESLKSILLNKLPLSECQTKYEGVDEVDINEGVICASGEARGICFGDSGAPMVIDNVLVGLSSFYKDCGSSEYPDVFTRIDTHSDWIMEVATAPGRIDSPIRIANVF